jgi:hypothetical protein
MRGLDSNSAVCRALTLLCFFWSFAGAPVSQPTRAFLTRPRPFSLFRHLQEQNRGRRPMRRCSIRLPQEPQARIREA